jgi:hypothetical protein
MSSGGPVGELISELTRRPSVNGISAADLVGFPDPLRSMLRRLLRRGGAKLPDLALDLRLSVADTEEVVDLLLQKGILQYDGDGYQIRTRRVAGRSVPRNL